MNKFKSLGDAIGMPDDRDRDFINRLILEFDKKNPGVLKYTIDNARAEQNANSTAFNDITKFGLVDKQSGRRHMFELPEQLYVEIEKYYPTMFREKKHFAWFCKKFKTLKLPEY